MRKLVIMAVAAVLLQAAAAQAATIYNNGAPNQADGNEATQWIQAEDFTLTTDVVLEDIHFWTVEAANAYQGSIVYRIYGHDAGGNEPDETNILLQGTVSPTRVATGNVLFFGNEYSYDFNIAPLALGAGTYWLGLHNGPLTTTNRLEWYWETTAANATRTGEEDVSPFDAGGWFNNGRQHAFYLTGTAVPEPASLLLMGSGLVGLVRARSRRRR